jgi:hypothetical protein
MQLLRCMELRFQELYQVDDPKFLKISDTDSQLCRLLSDSTRKPPTEHAKVMLSEVLELKNSYLEMIACIELDIDRKEELFQYLRQNNKIESNTLFKYNQVIHSSNTKIDKMIQSAFGQKVVLPTYYYTALISLYSHLRGDSRKVLLLKNLLKGVLNRLESSDSSQELGLDLPETVLAKAVVFTSTIQQNENTGLITDISPNFEAHLGNPKKPVNQLNLNDWFPVPLREIHKKMMIKESANFPKVFNKQIKFFIETYDDDLKEISTLMKINPTFNQDICSIGVIRVSQEDSKLLLVTDSSLNVVSANRLFWEFIDTLNFPGDFTCADLLCDELVLGMKLARAVAQYKASVAASLEKLPESQDATQSIRRLSFLLDIFESKNLEHGWSYCFRKTTELLKVRRDMLRAAFKRLQFGELELWQISSQLEKEAAPNLIARNGTTTFTADNRDPRLYHVTSIGTLRSPRHPVRSLEYLLKEFQLQGHRQRKTV